MELAMYLVGYIIVLSIFVSFGRFMKECDQTMVEQFHNESVLKTK
ncbi:MAG: hypothetical protein ACOYNS_08275 [Bacteroidota bacterium]